MNWKTVAFWQISGGGQRVTWENRVTGERVTNFGTEPPDDCETEADYKRRFYPDGTKRPPTPPTDMSVNNAIRRKYGLL